MKKKISIIMAAAIIISALGGCGSIRKDSPSEKTAAEAATIEASEKEEEAQQPVMETASPTAESSEPEAAEAQADNEASAGAITQDQALAAIKKYCCANNPELEEMADSDDVTVYFDVSENENGEIVVLYRSYTGALTRYYIDPSSGEVYVTEQVPGIIDDEQRTDESFNLRTYID